MGVVLKIIGLLLARVSKTKKRASLEDGPVRQSSSIRCVMGASRQRVAVLLFACVKALASYSPVRPSAGIVMFPQRAHSECTRYALVGTHEFVAQADPEADHTAAGIEFMESGAVQLGLDSFRVAAHLTPGATTWSNLCTALREEENPNRWQCTAEARTACQRALRFDHRHDAALEMLAEIPEHPHLSAWFNEGWADCDDLRPPWGGSSR